MAVATLRTALSCINNNITQSLYTDPSNYKWNRNLSAVRNQTKYSKKGAVKQINISQIKISFL